MYTFKQIILYGLGVQNSVLCSCYWYNYAVVFFELDFIMAKSDFCAFDSAPQSFPFRGRIPSSCISTSTSLDLPTHSDGILWLSALECMIVILTSRTRLYHPLFLVFFFSHLYPSVSQMLGYSFAR